MRSIEGEVEGEGKGKKEIGVGLDNVRGSLSRLVPVYILGAVKLMYSQHFVPDDTYR